MYGAVEGWINLEYCEYSYDIMVWVTDYGIRYHKKDCKYLKSINIIPFKEAAAKGYEPCKHCGGYGVNKYTNRKSYSIRSQTLSSQPERIRKPMPRAIGILMSRPGTRAPKGESHCHRHHTSQGLRI